MGPKKCVIAALAGLAFALPLSGCTFRTLHVQIPDFSSHQVEGVKVFRLDDTTGNPVVVGRINFVGVQTQPDGSELLTYQIVDASGWTSATIPTPVQIDPNNPDSATMDLYYDSLAQSGWFKVSSFNAYGSSPLSAQQTYLN